MDNSKIFRIARITSGGGKRDVKMVNNLIGNKPITTIQITQGKFGRKSHLLTGRPDFV